MKYKLSNTPQKPNAAPRSPSHTLQDIVRKYKTKFPILEFISEEELRDIILEEDCFTQYIRSTKAKKNPSIEQYSGILYVSDNMIDEFVRLLEPVLNDAIKMRAVINRREPGVLSRKNDYLGYYVVAI